MPDAGNVPEDTSRAVFDGDTHGIPGPAFPAAALLWAFGAVRLRRRANP